MSSEKEIGEKAFRYVQNNLNFGARDSELTDKERRRSRASWKLSEKGCEFHRKGEKAMEEGDYEKALNLFAGSLKCFGAESWNRLERGICYLNLEERKKALMEFSTALFFYDSNPELDRPIDILGPLTVIEKLCEEQGFYQGDAFRREYSERYRILS